MKLLADTPGLLRQPLLDVNVKLGAAGNELKNGE
jgi:hypothetical protein